MRRGGFVTAPACLLDPRPPSPPQPPLRRTRSVTNGDFRQPTDRAGGNIQKRLGAPGGKTLFRSLRSTHQAGQVTAPLPHPRPPAPPGPLETAGCAPRGAFLAVPRPTPRPREGGGARPVSPLKPGSAVEAWLVFYAQPDGGRGAGTQRNSEQQHCAAHLSFKASRFRAAPAPPQPAAQLYGRRRTSARRPGRTSVTQKPCPRRVAWRRCPAFLPSALLCSLARLLQKIFEARAPEAI